MKVKVYGHLLHYRPSEIFILELPDEYYKEVFEHNILHTDIIIDDVIIEKEEKQAIEMLEKFITEHKLYNIKQSDDLELNIKKVLNFIEKQQKEIEELYEVLEEWINGERYNDIFYISKDKIRELIENNIEDIDYSVHDIIKDLEKLLEDKEGI